MYMTKLYGYDIHMTCIEGLSIPYNPISVYNVIHILNDQSTVPFTLSYPYILCTCLNGLHIYVPSNSDLLYSDVE